MSTAIERHEPAGAVEATGIGASVAPTPINIDLGTLVKTLSGDLSALTDQARAQYMIAACNAVGVDYRLAPFKVIKVDGGGLKLYADAGLAQMIADSRNIDVPIVERHQDKEFAYATARARHPNGRVADRQGIVYIGNLSGQKKADMIMKADTKAFRRAVLALCGLNAIERFFDPDVAGMGAQVDGRTAHVAIEREPDAASLPAPADAAKAALAEMTAEWRSQFPTGDPEAFKSYIARALGKEKPASEPGARADDYRAVASDIRDQPEALRNAMAAYSEAGGDPDAGEPAGQEMRDEMERALGESVPTRALATSRQLREFADKCRRQEGPDTVEPEVVDEAEIVPGATADGSPAPVLALGVDDPFQDDEGGAS